MQLKKGREISAAVTPTPCISPPSGKTNVQFTAVSAFSPRANDLCLPTERNNTSFVSKKIKYNTHFPAKGNRGIFMGETTNVLVLSAIYNTN